MKLALSLQKMIVAVGIATGVFACITIPFAAHLGVCCT